MDKNKAHIFRQGLRRTLLFWFLILSLFPMTLVSVISYINANRILYKDAENSLKLMSISKTREIGAYFNKMDTDLKLMSEMQANMQFLESLTRDLRESGKPASDFTKSFKWTMIVDEMGADLKTYQRTFGYHDIFLVDSDGNILFSVAGEDDLGTNLFNGKYSKSLFAGACKKSLETGGPVFSDYEKYAPSNNIVYGFITNVIVNNNGDRIGLIAFQFPLDMINKIMQERTVIGGRTVDIYLIGEDMKMRSDSARKKEKTVLKVLIDTEQTRLWKKQINEEIDIHDMTHPASIYDGPHGEPVLGVHSDISVEGVPFGVIAEIEKQEAFASVTRLGYLVLFLLLGTGVLVVFIAFTISRSIVRPVQTLSSGAKLVAGGKLDHEIQITTGNELGELADSFNDMVRNLRLTREKNEAQDWLKTGQAELNEKMRGEPDIATLGANIISFLAKYLKARVGAVYMADEEDRLKMIGSYAYNRRKKLSNEFMPGEGLVGQAALEKTHILVTDCPDDYISIHSGLGQALPGNILVFPLLLENTVKGVIELGAFSEFSDSHMVFLDQVAENIAIAINSVGSRSRMAMLLEQTRQQSEELQVQQEELKTSNEELETQTMSLKESEDRLRQQQKNLELTNAKLEEKTHDLEQQKAEITRKNDELETARNNLERKARELEITSKYKSEFLANMSHELRTPLNSLLILSRSFTDNKEGNLSGKQVEAAQIINKSGNDLLALINEILDLSRIESGKTVLNIEEIPLSRVASSIREYFSHMAEEKGIELNISLEEDLPVTMQADRQRLEQIIKNLVSNAMKFTDKGSITVSFNRPGPGADLSRSGLDVHNSLAVSVKDTGIGIPKTKQLEIFEAFQQADGSTSRKYGGTGLGLSISRELAKLLGGEIQLESETGKGSTFTVFLPLETSGQTAVDSGRTTVESGQTAVDSGQTTVDRQWTAPVTRHPSPSYISDDRDNLKQGDNVILVIEDDPNFAEIMQHQCHEKGFKCLISEKGEDGLKLADKYPVNAIILDIKLPGLDGWMVLDTLKVNFGTRHIPVHMMSAFQEQAFNALKKGAIGFLTKPPMDEDVEAVFVKINDIIKKEMKDLLVAEDDPVQQQRITELIGNSDVKITGVSTCKEAAEALGRKRYDCMILDFRLPDMTGLDFLKKMAGDKAEIPPVIVYTLMEISKDEEHELLKYSHSVIIKGEKSEERLVDETALFLHRVVSRLPRDKQKMISDIRDKDQLFIGKKILLADDDMRNVYALSGELEEKGMKVCAAENGVKALEVLSREIDTDLVLMDVMMPVMDGYETIRKIREQPKYARLPVIALTAKAMKGDREKCIEAGANDYLSKPVNVDQLFSMMKIWLYR
ncbi:MAG: response regulator [Desulfobacterales bacterium]|nr:response regulator [Desulfobacterales bacterium]